MAEKQLDIPNLQEKAGLSAKNPIGMFGIGLT